MTNEQVFFQAYRECAEQLLEDTSSQFQAIRHPSFAPETLGWMTDKSARKPLCYQSFEAMNRPSIPRKCAELRTFSDAVIKLNIKENWVEARAGIEPACADLQSAT